MADQEESHKAALKAVWDSEAALQAEYETEAASWAEATQTLINGYGQIEDLVDGAEGGLSPAQLFPQTGVGRCRDGRKERSNKDEVVKEDPTRLQGGRRVEGRLW